MISHLLTIAVHMLQSLKGKSNEEEMERQWNEFVIVLGLDEIAQEASEQPAIMSPPYSAEFMEFCKVCLPRLLDYLYDTLFSIGTLRQIALAEKAERVPILAENMPQVRSIKNKKSWRSLLAFPACLEMDNVDMDLYRYQFRNGLQMLFHRRLRKPPEQVSQ